MGLLAKKRGEPRWVKAALETDFRVTLQVTVEGVSVALLRDGAMVYCTQASCSHEYSPLCDGIVANGEVYCEKHGSRFRLSDGAVLSLPATDGIKTYPVRVENGEIWVLL